MLIYKIKRIKPNLLILILIALAVSPAFALGDGNRNLLLIGVMGLSPIIILHYSRFDRINIWLLLFMGSIIVFPLIFHPESMRWSTVLYSVMFCLTFMAYSELLQRSFFTPRYYQKLLKYLIYAYAITLVIQQFCVLTGLPIFNVSNYFPNEPWKLNSLAAEPSHSARIVALLMYCYITITELLHKRIYNFKIHLKKDKWVWLAFIWVMVTMGSGIAFLFIGIVLLKFISLKNLAPLFFIGGVILFLVNNFNITAFDRTYKTVLATLTFNEEAIIEADHSASFRIVPSIVLIKMIDVELIDFWFGYGVDYINTFMYRYMPGGGENVRGGGLFQVLTEFGFISFILFVIFSFKECFDKRNMTLSIVFWFMLIILNGINSQITWLAIILLYSNRVLFNKYNNEKRFNISNLRI